MSEFVCKSCGAVVTAEAGTERLFCGHCGNMVLGSESENIFYAKPVPVDERGNSIERVSEPFSPVTEPVKYSTKTFEQHEAERTKPGSKSPFMIALVIATVVAFCM